MLGNFTYCNPTKLYFGQNALDGLNEELPKYGKNILLVYGGSVCDYAKAVSVSVHCHDDPWEKYFIRFEEPSCEIIPVGCVLTMVGTGSEMNGGSVITNHAQKLKIGHVFGDKVFPKFSVMNPEFTYTLPKYQMVSGIYDIMSHILEQYFSGTDDNTSDYIMEGLLRSLIHSANIAVENPTDYEARSNIMWTATWALNTLVAKGKTTDWMVHMLGQAVAAHTDATHGMTLAAVSMTHRVGVLPLGVAALLSLPCLLIIRLGILGTIRISIFHQTGHEGPHVGAMTLHPSQFQLQGPKPAVAF